MKTKNKIANPKTVVDSNYYIDLVASADPAVITLDEKFNIVTWNRGAERMYGYKKKEALGENVTFLSAVFSEDIRRDESLDEAGRKGIWRGEVVQKKKDGNIIHVFSSISRIKNQSGQKTGYVAVNRDISDMKFHEDNLIFLSDASKILASSLDYRTTLHTVAKLAVPAIADWCAVDVVTSEGILQLAVVHKDPKKVKWAKALRKKSPLDTNATTGMLNVLRTGKSEFYPLVTAKMLIEAAKTKAELKLFRNLRLTSAMLVPLLIRNRTIGVISLVSAESGRHYTKADLVTAEELAVRASLAIENSRLYTEAQNAISIRNEFVSIASHELKTPITSLKVYAEILKKKLKDADPKYMQYLDKVEGQVDKMTMLIHDLLDISKIQSGRMEFNMKKFDLNKLVQETAGMIKQTTEKQKIKVVGKIGKEVLGDRERISQVIVNLLTNAIKYSDKSKEIIVSLKSDKDFASVTVKDFGIGIGKEFQVKIFERFYRADDPKVKTYPGIGMGLYIAAQIVERHGGKISVDSEKGKGSTFTFSIPYSKGRKP